MCNHAKYKYGNQALGVVIRHGYLVYMHLLCDAHPCARVGRQVDPGDPQFPGQLGGALEEEVLLWAEGPDLDGDVVADHDDRPPIRVLCR